MFVVIDAYRTVSMEQHQQTISIKVDILQSGFCTNGKLLAHLRVRQLSTATEPHVTLAISVEIVNRFRYTHLLQHTPHIGHETLRQQVYAHQHAPILSPQVVILVKKQLVATLIAWQFNNITI